MVYRVSLNGRVWDWKLSCFEETITVLLIGQHDWEMTLGTHVPVYLRRGIPGTSLPAGEASTSARHHSILRGPQGQHCSEVLLCPSWEGLLTRQIRDQQQWPNIWAFTLNSTTFFASLRCSYILCEFKTLK